LKKKAVALSYSPSSDVAPKVIATGTGAIAMKICQIAEMNEIQTISDEALVESLVKLPIGSEIPREMYDSVAIIFRYLLSASTKKNN